MNVANDCAVGRQTALREELAELVAEYAPRRFALCWLDLEEADGGVLAWGLVLPSGVVVVADEDGRPRGAFRSAESARKLLSRRRDDLVLVWLDEAGPDEPALGFQAQVIASGP